MIAALAMAAQAGKTVWGIFLMVMFVIGHSVLLVTVGTVTVLWRDGCMIRSMKRSSKTLRTVMGVLILLIGGGYD